MFTSWEAQQLKISSVKPINDYLFHKVTASHDSDFRFSGFDLDVVPTGAR